MLIVSNWKLTNIHQNINKYKTISNKSEYLYRNLQKSVKKNYYVLKNSNF